MQQLIAYYESIDPAGALANIAAVPDDSIFTSGDDIRIPDEIANIIGVAALTAAANLDSARVTSPTLRTLANLDIEPIVNAVVFGDIPEILFHPMEPIPISGNEALQFQINSNPASAEAHYGLIMLADGPQQRATGRMFTVGAAGAASLSAGVWVNTSLTFSQTLPNGVYDVVGLRARGTNLVAARLVFVGGKWRPGVPAVNAIGDKDLAIQRFGRSGVLGRFDTNQPPTLDCLGVTDSAQEIMLDLIKVG